MQIFTTAILLSGLTSLVAGAAWGPPGGFKPPFPYPTHTTTKAVSKTTATTTAKPTTTKTTTKTTTTTTTTSTVASVTCLSSAAASYLVNGYASLLTAYDNNTANALLASDFTDTSDSINYLAGYALGTTTFPSKAAFEAGQGSQQAIGFTVASIDFSCLSATFRWTASLGQYPVKGINILYASNLNATEQGWQVETMYSEFNVGAWELDIGASCGPYSPGDTVGS